MGGSSSAEIPGYASVFVVGVVLWLAFFLLGIYVARQKGRPIEEGMVLSAIFGPFGVMIVALLPTGHLPRD